MCIKTGMQSIRAALPRTKSIRKVCFGAMKLLMKKRWEILPEFSAFTFPDPPTLAFLEEKARETRKKQGFFSSQNPLKSLGKGRKKTQKSKENQEIKKNKEIKKSKDWRVRGFS